MKINFFYLLIVFGIAALMGYALFAANRAETDIPLANALGGGIAFFVTLSGAVAVSAGTKGATMNMRIVSKIFFTVLLLQQIIFTLVPFRIAPYIIITGVLTLVYLMVAYGIGRSLD